MKKPVVIEVSAPILNEGVQFHPDVPEETRELLVNAPLEIAADEKGREALNKAYQWTVLERHQDDIYDPYPPSSSGGRR